MRNAMITIIVLAFLALAVASVAPNGCNGTAPTPDNSSESQQQPAVFKTGNPASDRLLALPQSQRAAVLGTIAGEGCVGNRAFYSGIYTGKSAGQTKTERQLATIMSMGHNAFWSVGCVNGESYEIEIDADAAGSARVLNCATAKILNVNCFVRFSDRPQAQEPASDAAGSATTRGTSPKATWIAMFFTSSCDRAQADVTYDVEDSMQQEKDPAPTLVGGLYLLRSSDEIFTISAQDDPPTDDNGDSEYDCSDVKVSIWSFYGSRPSNPYYEWFAEHGKLLNSAESTERYGIADTTWTASQ